MTLKTSVLSVCAAALLAGAALGQMPPPPPAPPPVQYERAPVYDPGQLPAFNGRVQQFTLTPRGDIDGFILTDGTEVKTPPHLSTQIAVTLRNGDAATIRGLRAAAIPPHRSDLGHQRRLRPNNHRYRAASKGPWPRLVGSRSGAGNAARPGPHDAAWAEGRRERRSSR